MSGGNHYGNPSDNPMDKPFFIVEDLPEGGYFARALGCSIYTEADAWMDLKLAVQDAVKCHFEETTKPNPARLLYQETK